MFIKEKQAVVCKCGKTIPRPHWCKNHITTAYHKNHSEVVIKQKVFLAPILLLKIFLNNG